MLKNSRADLIKFPDQFLCNERDVHLSLYELYHNGEDTLPCHQLPTHVLRTCVYHLAIPAQFTTLK